MHRPLCLLLLTLTLAAQDTRFQPQNEEFPGPPDPASFSEWLADIQHWRAERRIRIGYDASQYARPELKWAQSSFIQPQMMVEDRFFYDPVARKYTVDRYLDDLEKRYGGIDSVLVWHTYPNIGIDDRNQNDLLQDMPGGLAGLKQMVADFHRRGVRVLFPIMLWDQGTHSYGEPNHEATARLFKEAGADGVNGDTMRGVPLAYRAASDRAGHPLVLEPENGLDSDEMVMYNNMTWGYWRYAPIPTISRYKWLETRHMVNICRRWARDKTDDLQHAFFNGVGYESWENIWGIWNQIPDRHAEALRRISKIERKFAQAMISPDWEPHTPVLQPSVYASKFPDGARAVWTFVNRNEYDVAGRQIRVPHSAGVRYFDLWNGVELKPEVTGAWATLSFAMEAHGYGALLAAASAPDGPFLAEMAALSRTPLSSYSAERRTMPQRVVEIAPTAKAKAAPAGMIRIAGGAYDFKVSGIMIEGSNEIGVDVQYAWENSPRRHHAQTMTLAPYFIDRFPVTNAEFKKFVDAASYKPADDHNFLKDWKGGTYPAGWANKPVTWVSIEDARAYAKWAGKRLPHEWEWQFAAQGPDGRTYPWGSGWDAGAAPVPDKGHNMAPAADIGAHPRGASPFGVEDLVGNVWQWTDEYVDEHTRTGILKGGSHYQPQGSHWYFPQAYKLGEHGKYLLIAPGKDRSGGVGFRCVVDAE
ncbi:MAG: SUMF1/EgtB/PvdO family nonheme iron enzyme [Acidobacteria bacterium]|nr:SUMF1/EgtB/PvdO family nonheme iron enzyme [Acidobacteriota bacterium]